MALRRSGALIKRSGTIEEKLARKRSRIGLLRRDPAQVKAFWDNVRESLLTADDEIYSAEDASSPGISTASVINPSAKGPPPDGMKMPLALVELPAPC